MKRSPRLRVELLEARDVPAGNITAEVVNGVLVLSGDEDNNSLTFQMGAGGVTVTPYGGTRVNNELADTAVTLAAATGLKADLGDGDDTFSLVGTTDLILPKGAKIALGDGFNNLNLITTGTIDLASLTVTGTDGFDQVTVRGGAANPNKIVGAASFNLGGGGADVRLENLNLPGAAGLKVTAGAGNDELTLTNVTVAKTLTAKLGQGEGNDVRVFGGQIGSLTATSLGGNLTLANTTVKKNASFTTAGISDSEITGTTVGGILKFKTTQPYFGYVILGFNGTGALGRLTIDAAQLALISFRSGATYPIARDVSITGRNGYAQLNVVGATVTARNVAINSRESSATLVVYNAGRLELSGNATMTGGLNGSAGLSAVDGGTVVARNVALTSRDGGASMAVYNAGHLDLSGNLTLTGALSTSATLSTGGVIEIAGDLKIAAAGTANVQVSDANLTARHVTLTSTGAVALLTQYGASTIDLAGSLSLTGRTRANFSQTNGAATTVAGDLTVTSRDDARFTQKDANTKLTIGGDWKVRSDFGLIIVDVKGQSLSVAGATTLDGGYGFQTAITTTVKSTLTAPVSVVGGTRVRPPTRSSFQDEFIADMLNIGTEDIKSGDIVIAAHSARFFRPDEPYVRRNSGIPMDIQIGSPGRPVTIEGGLLIQTGGANDTVTLRDLTVGGKTAILTGGGNDRLTIDNSTFTGTFFADLGTGSDLIAIAQAAGSAATVTLTGRAVIRGGSGSDTLQLGRLAGDTNSKAVFVAAGSKVDGGAGVDTFDDELGQFEGLVLGTGIVGWDDPTA